MQLAELFPKGSPDPTDENFVPSWFLVENHQNTSFAKLKVCLLVVRFLSLFLKYDFLFGVVLGTAMYSNFKVISSVGLPALIIL